MSDIIKIICALEDVSKVSNRLDQFQILRDKADKDKIGLADAKDLVMFCLPRGASDDNIARCETVGRFLACALQSHLTNVQEGSELSLSETIASKKAVHVFNENTQLRYEVAGLQGAVLRLQQKNKDLQDKHEVEIMQVAERIGNLNIDDAETLERLGLTNQGQLDELNVIRHCDKLLGRLPSDGAARVAQYLHALKQK